MIMFMFQAAVVIFVRHIFRRYLLFRNKKKSNLQIIFFLFPFLYLLSNEVVLISICKF